MSIQIVELLSEIEGLKLALILAPLFSEVGGIKRRLREAQHAFHAMRNPRLKRFSDYQLDLRLAKLAAGSAERLAIIKEIQIRQELSRV